MKMLASLVLVGIVLFGIGAGTWAQFTDTETSTDNYIAAGTLDLVVGGENPLSTSLNYTDEFGYVYPGWEDSTWFYVKNDGSIDGKLYLDISYSDSPGLTPEPEQEYYAEHGGSDVGELSQYLYVEIYYSDDTNFDASKLVWNGYVSEWPGEKELGELPAGEIRYIKVKASIDSDVGNIIQGDSLTVNVTFTLKQDT
ncbi:TasA family protein [Thermococcus radiotolerans]|uniref:Uncharacterized protein n=1 Tax=Thermococcus radiotolerans TaxID=187880 RepID=A0A2Z2MZL7_9EURY|nr:TasA family protein [Thermococcus radiotolerans]ASJ15265.1 hypothetical protein A3L10_09040 [Thermococcus radiotolerans]